MIRHLKKGMCLETSHVGGMIRLAKKLSSCLFLILWQVLVKARDNVRKRLPLGSRPLFKVDMAVEALHLGWMPIPVRAAKESTNPVGKVMYHCRAILVRVELKPLHMKSGALLLIESEIPVRISILTDCFRFLGEEFSNAVLCPPVPSVPVESCYLLKLDYPRGCIGRTRVWNLHRFFPTVLRAEFSFGEQSCRL
ncbi:hypothetical protein F2Q69_00053157 [Brassica cretica]|uniref:Uncharacterized protein n=1 Tax=Brassica cretica TaxID=69181 RepID=A0A8S9MWE5_BRACR|nr:hypothetical protein F2Q69_00053157 [Brassica cretica]